MRKKQFTAKIGALCLMLFILFPTTAFAADQTTKITAKIPDTHTVRLEIGVHGSVTVGTETYTGTQEIEAERLSEVSYMMKAEDRYKIDTVTYDGTAVTDMLHENIYQAPPVNKDGIVLKVDFILKESEKVYPPTSGTDTSWGKDKEDGLSINVSENLGEITEVTVDGQILGPNDYTVSGQPPVVTLKPEFLETLANGKHIVRIQGESGYTEVTITVEKKTFQQGTTNSDTAKTGDKTPVMLFMVIALLSGGFLCAIALRKNALHKK